MSVRFDTDADADADARTMNGGVSDSDDAVSESAPPTKKAKRVKKEKKEIDWDSLMPWHEGDYLAQLPTGKHKPWVFLNNESSPNGDVCDGSGKKVFFSQQGMFDKAYSNWLKFQKHPGHALPSNVRWDTAERIMYFTALPGIVPASTAGIKEAPSFGNSVKVVPRQNFNMSTLKEIADKPEKVTKLPVVEIAKAIQHLTLACILNVGDRTFNNFLHVWSTDELWAVDNADCAMKFEVTEGDFLATVLTRGRSKRDSPLYTRLDAWILENKDAFVAWMRGLELTEEQAARRDALVCLV